MIHDSGLGRETDIGEFTGRPAYNPYTGQGYNPPVANTSYRDVISQLHLRDEGGRVQAEHPPTLIEMIQSIHDAGTNVVLQLDFKVREAVEPTYWALKTLTNAAGVPANEWCVYKMQAAWHHTPADLEAEAWVQDAFASGIKLAYLPVYQHADVEAWDVVAAMRAYQETNYTISAEVEMFSSNGNLQSLHTAVEESKATPGSFSSSGIFYAPGDVVQPLFKSFSWYDLANYSALVPRPYGFQDNAAPVLIDSTAGVKKYSVDGHDHRSDFAWILEQGYDWVITDTADVWDQRLRAEGRRNVGRLVKDGAKLIDGKLDEGSYRRHAREFGR